MKNLNFNIEMKRKFLFMLFLFIISFLKAQELQVNILNTQNAECNNLGVIVAEGIGGQPPYSASAVSTDGSFLETQFNLLDGQDFTFNVPVGEYFIFVSDQLGVTDQCQGIIDINYAPPNMMLETSHLLCSGNDASATISATLSCNPNTTYTFSLFSPDGLLIGTNTTGVFAEGITQPGIYNVTVSNDDGNTSTASILVESIVEHSDIGLQINELNHSCHPNQDGTVNISAYGAAFSTIEYHIFNTSTGEIQSNATGEFIVTPGIYTQWFEFTIDGTDGTCYWECPGGFVVYASDLDVISTVTSTLCDLSVGEVQLEVSGSDQFIVDWSTGASGPETSLTGLAAGTYTYVVTDVPSNCTFSGNFEILSYNPLSATVTNVQNELCPEELGEFGYGAAEIMVENGSAPYSVNVFPSGGVVSTDGNTINISELTAGTYTVQLTDINGCETQTNFEIVYPDPFVLEVLSQTNPTCDNNLQGEATIMISGGDPNHEIFVMWPGGDGISINRTITVPLSVGTNGFFFCLAPPMDVCFSNFSIDVEPPNTPELSISNIQDEICIHDNNGSFQAFVTNYLGTETALLNGTSVGISPSGAIIEDNLPSGEYILEVEDPATGCLALDTFQINTGVELLGELSGLIPCSDNTEYFEGYDSVYEGGTLGVSVTGGSGTYSYTWNNGDTNPTLNNIYSGTYTVTVIDETNSCLVVLDTTIVAPPPLELDYEIVQTPLCFGDSAVIEIFASGGTPSYAYYVNGVGQGTNNMVTINYGEENVEIAICDSRVCFVRDTIINIDWPSNLLSLVSPVNATCRYDYGSASALAWGGTPPYEYLWNNGETSSQIDSIFISVYVAVPAVTVTDANGCQTVSGGEVWYDNEPPYLDYTLSPENCGGGAKLDLAYANPFTTQIHVNGVELPLGTMTWDVEEGDLEIVATSEVGCVTTKVDYVDSSDFPFELDLDIQDACEGQGALGITIIDAENGTYTIEFNGNSFEGENAGEYILIGENLNPGEYALRIKSPVNCILDTIVQITNSTEPISSVVWEPTGTSCLSATDGSLLYEVTGGGIGVDYEYKFHNINTSDTSQWIPLPPNGLIEGLMPGEYQMLIRVSGENSPCAPACLPFTIEQGTVLCQDDSYFWLSPYLVSSGSTLYIHYNFSELPQTGGYTIRIFDISGNVLHTYGVGPIGTINYNQSLPAGTYFVILYDANQSPIETQQFIVY